MVESRFLRRTRGQALRVTLLTVAILALVLAGTARAGSTVVSAGVGEASIIGQPPVTMSFPLERLGDLGYDTWLRYQTEDGTARAGDDYTAAGGQVKVPAGSSEESVSVQVSGKAAFAPDKQFTMKLFGAVGVGPNPRFAERVSFAAGSVAGRAKAIDVNADGRPDLVVPNSNTVSVLINTTAPGASTPSFAAAKSFEVGRSPNVAIADVNGDGRPDLVVTNTADDDFSVLLNTTAPGALTPGFAPQQVFEAGRGPDFPVIEDLNGDGRPDLVVVNDQSDENAISVFFNTTPPGASTVSFKPRQFFEFPAPGRVAVGDVNGDGRPDLIISAQAGIDEVFVILSATQPGASNLSLGGEASYPVGETPNEVSVADVNGDGRPDLAVTNLAGDSASVLLNETASGASVPSFAPQVSFAVGNEPRSIQAADLNGDGRVDLITGNHGSHSLSVLLNTTAPGASDPSFAIRTVEAEPIPLGLVTADLNGDGRQDLIYTRESGKLLVSLNTTAVPTAAAPSLAAKQDAAAGGHPSALAATDLNGDGKPDLVVANHDDDTASVLIDTTAPGASTPSFGAQQTFAAGNAPSSVATADFNGDGRPDVVITDEFAETASVLLNTTEPGAATPSFTARQTFVAGEAPAAVAAADFNGDGRPDIVIANHDENDVSVLLNTTAPGASTLSFTARQTFAVGNAPSSVATADFNGDGRPDLVVANEGSDSASVLFDTTAPGASTPSFSPSQSFEAGDAPSSAATADVNGDGVPDLLVSDEGGNTASVFLDTTGPGAGTPSFSGREAFTTGNDPTAIAAADLNGDGGPDVLTADGGADTISALLDTQYAASVSSASVIGTIHYAIPQLTLDPGLLAFGNQVVGSVATKTVTVSNTGGADLAIGGIGVGAADGGGFVRTSTCLPTLATGSSCSIDVSFTPNAVGAASAALTVASNAPTGANTVALSGTGITPPSPTHMLTVKLAGGGGGRVDGGAGAISCPSVCSHVFADGAGVTLTAIPTSGSTFAGWSRGGCAGASTCRVTVGSDTTVSARFAKAPPAGARLRIVKASAKGSAAGLRISVRGTIVKGARGKVGVKALIRTHGSWVTVIRRAKIARGRWGTHLALGTATTTGSPIRLSARFSGSPGFHSGHAARRLSVP